MHFANKCLNSPTSHIVRIYTNIWIKLRCRNTSSKKLYILRFYLHIDFMYDHWKKPYSEQVLYMCISHISIYANFISVTIRQFPERKKNGITCFSDKKMLCRLLVDISSFNCNTYICISSICSIRRTSK